MNINQTEWLKSQTQEFKDHIGQDIKKYQSKRLTLKELQELDDRFINNSPEGVE